MNEKGVKGAQQNGKEKSVKSLRHQFWAANGKEEGKSTDGVEHLKRPESSVSRQFLPKKQQGVSEAWTKHANDPRDEQRQPFGYTPFKSGSLNRPPSAAPARGPTPSLNVQAPGIVREAVHGYDQSAPNNPYQIYEITSNVKDMDPQGQSTPKMAPHHGTRQRSPSPAAMVTASIPRPVPNGIWWGPSSGVIPPPPAPYRPSSAMNPQAVARPTSRAASELAFGGVAPAVGITSRYQSYTTLPRPEMIDFDTHTKYASEIGQMAHQINALYGSYPSKQSNEPSSNIDNPGSRSVPSMLMGAPGMASDYVPGRPPVFKEEPADPMPVCEEASLKTAKDIVYFDGISLLSVFQVLCGIAIFTCGVMRLIWHAKWAFGVELFYAMLVFTTGGIGLYANAKRCHCAATAMFTLSSFNALLAIVPLLLGLFPAIPAAFVNAQLEWFANEDESHLLDYLLSFACFLEMIVALISSGYGCKAIGSTMTHVEKLRLNADLSAAFDTASISLPKSTSDSADKKASLR